jgi:hypothetical protein
LLWPNRLSIGSFNSAPQRGKWELSGPEQAVPVGTRCMLGPGERMMTALQLQWLPRPTMPTLEFDVTSS